MKRVFFLAIGLIFSQCIMAQNPFDVGTDVNATKQTKEVTKEDVVVVENSRHWKAAGYQNAKKSGELFEITQPMYIIEVVGTGVGNFTIARTDNVRFTKTFKGADEAKNYKLQPGKYSVLPNKPKGKSSIDAFDVNLGLVLSPIME